jgi:MFS family permease
LRGVMGMAIAGLLPSVAKLIRNSVKDNQSGKMLGYLQSAQFSGQVIGPVLGGQIGVHFGFHWVFFMTSFSLLACAALNQWAKTANSRMS